MSYTFTLPGADGEQHAYGGTALGLQIYALAGGALGSLLKGLLDSAGGLGGVMELFGGDKKLGDIDLDALLGGLDMGELGAALAGSLVRLPPRVLQDLLAHTSRDGAPLKQEAHYNTAYRANYPELMQAAALVAYHNGFFSFGAMPASKKAAPEQIDDSATPADSQLA
jgi:hypothetical protein